MKDGTHCRQAPRGSPPKFFPYNVRRQPKKKGSVFWKEACKPTVAQRPRLSKALPDCRPANGTATVRPVCACHWVRPSSRHTGSTTGCEPIGSRSTSHTATCQVRVASFISLFPTKNKIKPENTTASFLTLLGPFTT